MKKIINGTIWPTKKIGVYPQYYVEQETEDMLKITGFATQDIFIGGLYIDKKMARLLAKRINQCLDNWRIK